MGSHGYGVAKCVVKWGVGMPGARLKSHGSRHTGQAVHRELSCMRQRYMTPCHAAHGMMVACKR